MTAPTVPLSWLGRSELEKEVETLRARCMRLSTEIGTLVSERDAYARQLTEVQDRCTTLLQEVRSLRPLREFSAFALALSVARDAHPEGTLYRDMIAEVEEAIEAHENESDERLRAELLDVAVTAWRVAVGGDRRTP